MGCTGFATSSRFGPGILQYWPAGAVHAETRVSFDDRLLVAPDGEWLREPVRERPFDVRALTD